MPFNMTINGELTNVSHIEPDTHSLWTLQDQLDLVETKYGYGIAQCGTCKQSDLAEAIDVTRQIVHAIEKGKYDPGSPLAFKIA